MADNKCVIGERITKLRKRSGMTQIEISQKVHIHKDLLSRIVNGKAEPSIQNAMKIAQHFNVSVDYLFGNSDIENINEYVFDIITKHIKSMTNSIHYGEKNYPIPSISISQNLADFLKVLYLTERHKNEMPEEARIIWISEARQKFISAIREDKITSKKFAIIPSELLTEKLMAELEALQIDPTEFSK